MRGCQPCSSRQRGFQPRVQIRDQPCPRHVKDLDKTTSMISISVIPSNNVPVLRGYLHLPTAVDLTMAWGKGAAETEDVRRVAANVEAKHISLKYPRIYPHRQSQ